MHIRVRFMNDTIVEFTPKPRWQSIVRSATYKKNR